MCSAMLNQLQCFFACDYNDTHVSWQAMIPLAINELSGHINGITDSAVGHRPWTQV